MGLLAVARAVTALGRESFIPPIFSLVSAKLGTPIFTTAILGIITGERLPSGLQTFSLVTHLFNGCCTPTAP